MTYGKPDLFTVQLTEEFDEFPEGTVMYVEKELKYCYKGTVVMMMCTLSNVKFPKTICQPFESSRNVETIGNYKRQ